MTYLVTIISIALLLSLYKNYRLGVTILRVEDSIEESLDEIDRSYRSISEILKRPLFYDSEEVRQVIDNIKNVRATLHKVAYSLATTIEEDEGEDGAA